MQIYGGHGSAWLGRDKCAGVTLDVWLGRDLECERIHSLYATTFYIYMRLIRKGGKWCSNPLGFKNMYRVSTTRILELMKVRGPG